MRFKASVEIAGLTGIADPAGQTIERALPALGFSGVHEVHVGKMIRFGVEAEDGAAARVIVERLCALLLVNSVIEQAAVQLTPDDPDTSERPTL